MISAVLSLPTMLCRTIPGTLLVLLLCNGLSLADPLEATAFIWDRDADAKNTLGVKCPEGSVWDDWSGTLKSDKRRKNNWAFAKDASEERVKSDGEGGVIMPMNQDDAKDLVMHSKFQWYPPVTMEVDVSSTGAPGIPSTLNMRQDERTGEEVDFIIGTRQAEPDKLRHFISMPLYKSVKSDKPEKLRVFDKDKDKNEVIVEFAEGVFFASNSSGQLKKNLDERESEEVFQENWALSWKGFDPAEMTHTYVLQWKEDNITWFIGEKNHPTRKVLMRKTDSNKDAFPKGPLPFRFGPYATRKEDDWAGVLDWEKYPNPEMTIAGLHVVGCRKTDPWECSHKSNRENCAGYEKLKGDHRKRFRADYLNH